jgi:hypothetical protein
MDSGMRWDWIESGERKFSFFYEKSREKKPAIIVIAMPG